MIEDYHRPGAITAEKAAKTIINGIKKEKKIIQFPFYQVLPTRFTDLLPPVIYDSGIAELQRGDGYPVVEEK
jgi:hypothetical protein